ncbi:Cas8a1 family CRISPR/Cas system-associated protein [Pectinatus frisingensis]|uniref:Cas8a1 family CRISPR/Cas system-associated protein n=1 Tax=Pectinatus frisingensis TaxID=865 RepID=UPI003D8010E5
MQEHISVYTSDFIYNAGIIGLIRLLETAGTKENADYETDNNELMVSKNFLINTDLAQAYINAHIAKFAQGSAYTRLLEDDIEKINMFTDKYAKEETKELKKKLDDSYTKLLGPSGLTRASYITACDILKSKNIGIDLKSECKNIKDIKDYQEKYQELLKLKVKLQNDICKETFLMKDIMYSRINSIWSGRAFLNKANAKKNVKEIYYKDFVEPVIKYLKKIPQEKKSSKHCIVCDAVLSKPIDISFLNDSADDMSRKKSAFWDYKPDAHLCPICAFIYSLAPLGFTAMQRDMVFVNNNTNIKTLLEISNSVEAITQLKVNDEDNKNIWYRIWNNIVQQILKEKFTAQNNIQVIVREKDKERYDFNVISKDVLAVLQNSMKYIKNIGAISIQLYPPDYFNVQDAVLRNILKRNNQYGLINRILRYSLQENKQVGFLYNVLMIQQKIIGGNNVKSVKVNMYIIRILYYEGQKLRGFLMTDRGGSAETDNKLRGFVFQLLNALQVGDDNRFWQLILKTYAGYGLAVPREFINGFANDDAFQQLGYAYILGLKSNPRDIENMKEQIEGDK